MSAKLTPSAALLQIAGFAEDARIVSTLAGGLTNRNYLVARGRRHYVLRLDDLHTRSFGIDRSTESRARASAAAAGLATGVVYQDAARGILLTEYLEGRVLGPSDLREPKTLTAVANLLRRVHSLPLLGRCFDAASAAKAYVRGLDAPAPFASHCLQIAAGSPPPVELRCCHNDVVAGNILDVGSLVLLDWEYAADNEPMFDLASLVCFHDLDEQAVGVLLTAYAGEHAEGARDRLAMQMRIYDALQWLWFAVRQQHSPARQFAARLGELQQRLTADRYGG